MNQEKKDKINSSIRKLHRKLSESNTRFSSFCLKIFKYVRTQVFSFRTWRDRIKAISGPLREVIKHKHRFVVMDQNTYKEKLSFQLSGINIFVTVGISMIVLVVLTTLLIAFTPLRELIPGYTSTKLVEQSFKNEQMIDSLIHVLDTQEWMLSNMQDVLEGKQMPGEESVHHQDSAKTHQNIQYTHSKEDSLLRKEMETVDKESMGMSRRNSDEVAASGSNTLSSLNAQLLFTPLKGKVISTYNPRTRHFGVDISGAGTETVKAIYAGTVVFSSFTVESGYVIVLQHAGNTMSVYKNNNELLKHEGDAVRAGEPISYVGNSDGRSGTPHLHFELWVNGKPVNPLQYISF